MRQRLKWSSTSLLLLSCWLLACTDHTDCSNVHLQSILDERQIPDTARVNEVVALALTAFRPSQEPQATLYVVMNEESPLSYSIRAYGAGCAYLDAVMTADTTILFQPAQAGIYLFHITETPQRTVTDTLVVL